MIEVKLQVAADWELMRDVRLRALADEPGAFGSDYAREATFTEQDWRGRFTTSVSFIAMDGDRAVGIVAGLPEDDGWLLVAMWVAPEARGRRVAALLIDAVVAEAARQGASTVSLDVFEHNAAARRAYERYGFVAVGESKPGMARMRLPVAK